MKSEIKQVIEKAKIKYPILAQARGFSFIVMFFEKSTGVIVSSKDASRPIGYFSNTWIEVGDSFHWEILSPETKIILSND